MQNDRMQLEIETFFKTHLFIESKVEKNTFNGFLIDFEFLFLKKNYSFKIKDHSKNEKSFFGGYFGGSKTKVKTKDMKGMVSSTVFTLNQSGTESNLTEQMSDTRSRAVSRFMISQETKLDPKDQIPFLLDYIVKYAQGLARGITDRSHQNSLSDLKNIEDFILHFNKSNMDHSSKEKLERIYKNLTLKMRLKVKVCKFFFSYLANYILLRPVVTSFSQVCVSFFEEMIMDSIANISQTNFTDSEFLLFLLIICQEIYMHHFYSGQKLFSQKFLKFFRKLNFLYNKNIWADLLQVLKEQTIDKNGLFYFFNPQADNSTGFYNKTVFNSKESLLLFLMQISFFLLQQPHQVILNNFIFVNQQTVNFPISKLMNISTFMEKSISSVYKTNRYVTSLPQKSTLPGVIFVVSSSLEFLTLEDKGVLGNMILLKRTHSNHFRKLFFNKILSEKKDIPKAFRKELYKKLMILDAENFYGSIAQSMYVTKEVESCQDSTTIIKMDVERTKFFGGDPEQLRTLLKNIGEYIPSVGYYQGLNCLGAFVLDYFEDFVFSFDIISFCLHKYMKKYFFGDFRKLNKLVFVGESLIQEYFPDVYSSVEKSGIGHGYYLSSVILTVYFSILQFCKCRDFILAALDLYTSEGWVGFYKVLPN